MRRKFRKSHFLGRQSATWAIALISASIVFAGIAVQADQTHTLTPPIAASESSPGCASVNQGKIDLQAWPSVGGGTTSASVSEFKSGEWLTVQVSASVALVTFLEVFDPGTTLRLQSKLVAELDPRQGKTSATASYPISELDSLKSLHIVTGYDGVGMFKVTVRCTAYDPRKASS